MDFRDLRVRWFWVVVAGLACGSTARGESDPATFFEARVRPLLVRKCVRCHGGERTSAGFRVTSLEAMMRGGDSGPALVPGKPNASLVVRAVSYRDDELQMPPDRRLDPREVETLRQWIADGATWPDASHPSTNRSQEHWAFQKLRPIAPPPATDFSNPIDRFLVSKLPQGDLSLNPRAEPEVLVRRLYFDLIGLPPPWNVVQEFSAAPSPAAFSQLIDKLLASPRYGERWGRHWLDLARYADTQGGSVDCPIPAAHLYRDYVIDAFNNDKPYDQFLREQIAGDLMPNPEDTYSERVVATGFLALSIRNGIFKHYHPELIIEDTIDTIGKSILGITLRCARCHDHKVEPITTADYYRLYGIFASSRYPFSGSELPPFSPGESVRLLSPAGWGQLSESQRVAIELLDRKIAEQRGNHAAQQELKEKQTRLARDVALYQEIRRGGHFDPELRTSIDDQDIRIREVVAKLDNSVRKLWEELKASEQRAGIKRAYAMREAAAHDAAIQLGGDPFDQGPVVPRGVPERLAGDGMLQIPATESGRLQLAEWITDSKNPLTARVAVNYIWQFHFGQGIVPTSHDFGWGGEAPTHPDLLDWLAGEFISSGWSVKRLHKLILTSRAWQASSTSSARVEEVDPGNRWRSRFDRHRLDAEALRDSMMFLAGTLDLTRPGPHPFPAESSWQFSQHAPFKAVYDSSHRSVYLMTQRLQLHPYLTLFDGPDTSRATTRRQNTAKTLQALYLRNSPFVHKQAEAFAKRLIAASSSSRDRIRQGVREAWGREATNTEVNSFGHYLKRFRNQAQRAQKLRDETASAELLLEYQFEGHARDSSGNNHHGILHGNPTFTTGKRGECISLDGTGDYVDSGKVLDGLGEAFAVECWVRPGPKQPNYAEIFGNHLGGDSRGFVLQQEGTSSNLIRGSFGAGGSKWVLCQPVQLQPGSWQHIALVRNATQWQLFVDRQLRSSLEVTQPRRPSELTFRVGMGLTLVDRCFLGEIDELRLYRGVPKAYRGQTPENQLERAVWSSLARLLLTSNDFLYVD